MALNRKKVCDAASRLRLKHICLTSAALARECNVPRRTMCDFFNHPIGQGLKDELGVETAKGKSWNRPIMYRRFFIAAETITERGERVSILTLTEELSWRRKRVCKYLQANPKLNEELKLYPDTIVLLSRAARAILSKGEQVTILSLAIKLNRSYQFVMRAIQKNPYLIEELGITRSKKGSGAYTYRKQKAHVPFPLHLTAAPML